MKRIVVFDIDRDDFRYAVGTSDGELTTEIFTETTTPSVLVDQIINKIAYVEDLVECSIDAACIASTGLVDFERGVIKHFDTGPNLPDQRNIPIREKIQEYFDIDIYVENDANAAVLGEYYHGTDNDYSTLIYLRIDSGIGAGIYENGRLIRGETHQAGEVGMIPVSTTSELESSQVPGSWEAYCSSDGIKQFVQRKLESENRDTALKQLPEIKANYLFETARAGDDVASDYITELGEYNSIGVHSLINIFNPGLISLGGDVALTNAEEILAPIRNGLDESVLVSKPDLRISPLGSKAGILGALSLYRYQNTSHE